jgi:hypothetical protein
MYLSREVIECFSIIDCSFNLEISVKFHDFDDIIYFLSLSFSKNLKNLYNKCIKIVTTDFQKIPIEYLKKLFTQTFELVFWNDAVIRQIKSFLFNFITKDPSKYILLNFIDIFKL